MSGGCTTGSANTDAHVYDGGRTRGPDPPGPPASARQRHLPPEPEPDLVLVKLGPHIHDLTKIQPDRPAIDRQVMPLTARKRLQQRVQGALLHPHGEHLGAREANRNTL